MANGWSLERRKRQAELIQRWRPWEKSTGPKTEAGKQRVSQNALKSGEYCAEISLMRRELAEQARFERWSRLLLN